MGTQVNVITGGNSGAVGQITDSHASSEVDTFDIPIKVVNPVNKRESKMYMLSLQLEKMTSLK